jgi:hypothetical protein
MRFRDISLQQFGRLMPSFPVGVRRWFVYWACLCSCGTTKVVREDALRTGASRSCGCFHREKVGSVHLKHGHTVGREQSLSYRSYFAAIQRCTNPKNPRWARYGGANPPVSVCERWLNSFEAFLEDLGERTEGRTLGRFGDVGNYSCGHCEQCKQNGWKLNCAWQTRTEQEIEQKAKFSMFGRKRSAIGRKKIHIRWHVNRGISNPACELCQAA